MIDQIRSWSYLMERSLRIALERLDENILINFPHPLDLERGN